MITPKRLQLPQQYSDDLNPPHWVHSHVILWEFTRYYVAVYSILYDKTRGLLDPGVSQAIDEATPIMVSLLKDCFVGQLTMQDRYFILLYISRALSYIHRVHIDFTEGVSIAHLPG